MARKRKVNRTKFNLVKKMRKSGGTQTQIAEEMDISDSTISRIDRSKSLKEYYEMVNDDGSSIDKHFKLAKTLVDTEMTRKQIGEVVADAFGRKKPYAAITITKWVAHGSYQEYLESIREKKQETKEDEIKTDKIKEAVALIRDAHNILVATFQED